MPQTVRHVRVLGSETSISNHLACDRIHSERFAACSAAA